MEQERKKKRLGKDACPKCSPGFVVAESPSMLAPAGRHCVICGWWEFNGIDIRHPTLKDKITSHIGPEIEKKKSHKKKVQQVGLTYAGDAR